MLMQALPTPADNPSPQGEGQSARRRGACPGLCAPMPTGDGLLVRLRPIGTVPLAAFAGLCAASRAHGSGVVEITARGSIQVRGLSAASAPRFAAAVAALGVAAEDGVPVLTSALAGLDPTEILDTEALAADLRRALARSSHAARLAPKISVAVDGGGVLGLDALAADVRLHAESGDSMASLRIAVGGDGASATQLGVVAPANGVEAAIRLLAVMAGRDPDLRARDILKGEGIAPFQKALASCPALCGASTSDAEVNDVDGRDRPGQDDLGTGRAVFGVHRLRDGSFARGVGLAFGHTQASALEFLAEAADTAGASGMRTAPGRVLVAIGLTDEAAASFAAAAERLGFIVCADDPRRHVVACAGAPLCASAHIAARAMAPVLAASVAPGRDDSFTIHVSGCPKGCALPAPAALTIVGTESGCALVSNGLTHDAPFAVVAASDLPATVARHARMATEERGHV
jgi:precorrin-3B synthase